VDALAPFLSVPGLGCKWARVLGEMATHLLIPIWNVDARLDSSIRMAIRLRIATTPMAVREVIRKRIAIAW